MNQIENFAKLKRVYKARGIALALGAGVSYDSNVPDWRRLLERIAQRIYGPTGNSRVTEMVAEGYSLPSIASVLEAGWKKNGTGSPKFAELIRDALYENFNYYNRALSEVRSFKFESFIKTSNPVLSAIASLCTQKQNAGHGFVANPLIHAVANTNFDAILSEYSKARFQTAIFRTVDRPSAKAISGRINVYHVHGFFQFVDGLIGDLTKEAPDIRVLTEQEFFDFFNRPNSLFNYTFLHLLREYTVLFIGMSLKDDNVRRLLHYSRTEMQESYERENISPDEAEAETIRHYAIQKPVKSSYLNEMTETSLQRLGIRVIWVDDFPDIPGLLAELYESNGKKWSDVL
ncbi:MAG TPA: SIR2 family protein [Pyrinomonadaceae bacterium]|nr:SIR2 family protein [Pyrinomonadaceae bacterium]